MIRKFAALLAGSSFVAIAAATPAAAQQDTGASARAAAQQDNEDEIVVTGSQIRGIAPAGVAVIGLGEEAIQASGATTGSEILSQIPQISNYFNSIPGVGGNSAQFVNRSAVSRPNLRALPNQNTANAPFTLALVDGHRMVPVGISNAAGFDPDSVSPSLVQRVEVMPDGASAIYGSDAVTGVINYITRDSFDGGQVRAHFGGSTLGYEVGDAGLTLGTDWDSGNAFFAVNASRHDALYGRDADYLANLNYQSTSPSFGLPGLACAPGNITIGSTIYPINSAGVVQAAAPAAGGNRCDISDGLTIVPQEETLGFMGGVTQQITDSLRLDVRAWVQNRDNVSNNSYFASPSPNVGSLSITSASPLYQAAPGTVGNPTQTLNLDLSPVLGRTGRQRDTNVDWWQISPRLTWDVGGDWQVRVLYSHGESDAESVALDLNTTGVNAAILAGTFNPYTNSGATTNFITRSVRRGEFDMDDAVVVADGPVLALPGGAIHVAVGIQRNELEFNLSQPGLVGHDEQIVDSYFGEVQIPIIGAGNRLPFVQSLFISASARQDHYDFAGSSLLSSLATYHGGYETTNPSIGLTWEPIDWLTIRGSWGTSFTSPNAQDRVVIPALTITNPQPTDTAPLLPWTATAWPFGASIESTPAMGPNAANAIALVLTSGSAPNLEPQQSENWSAGFDLRAPFLEGLTISGSFYSIHIENMLSSAATGAGLISILQNFPQLVYTNGGAPFTAAQIQAWTSQSTGLNTLGQGEYGSTFLACAEAAVPTCPVAYIADNRTQNLLELYVEGIDLSIRYDHDTDWGSWDVAFSGNNAVTFDQISGPISTDRLNIDNPEWKWALTGGVTLDNFRAQLAWQHTAGFDVAPGSSTSAPFGQSQVDEYNQYDLYFRYDLGAFGLTDSTSISLNINNVTDETPPPYNSSVGSYPGIFSGDGSFILTSGRFIQFGITSTF